MTELQNDSDRVGPDRECRLLADANGDDYQLKQIERRWFHALGSMSPGATMRHRSIRGTGIRQIEGMGPKRFILSVDDDAEFKSRYECMCIMLIAFYHFQQ